MSPECEFLHNDGAYVLGALDAADRTEYERHLAGCEECSRSVRDIARLTGLLARIPLEVLEPVDERVPDTLLPTVVTKARRDRRRRIARTVGLAVAAAAAVIAGTVAVVTLTDDDGPPVAEPSATEITTAPSQEMDALGPGTATGWVSLTEVAWGTRIDLTCSYGAGGYGGSGGWTSYALIVHTTDGRAEQVGTWRAAPGRRYHVTLAAAAEPDAIESVEVRTSDGHSVLRLTQ